MTRQVLNEIKNNSSSEKQHLVATLNHARKARKFEYDEDLYCLVVLKASCWKKRAVIEPSSQSFGPTEYPMVQIWRLVEANGWVIYDHNSYEWLPSSQWEKTILRDHRFGGVGFRWA